MELTRGLVVIPVFGKPEVTRAVLADCARERDLVDVLVVDNMGDFVQPDHLPAVKVIRPGRNTGWLGGTNVGITAALAGDWSWLVALNNDTRLCASFFAGMRAALAEHPGALVAPCYDDVVTTQTGYYQGRVEGFVPEEVETDVPVVDGTCFALRTELLADVGFLDGDHFGRRGWGAIEDYIIRTKAAGGEVMVTRRAYLSHSTGTTAHATMSTYHRYATSEMRRGLRRKHGADWRHHFSVYEQERDSPRVRLRDELRAAEDKLKLSETFIGRRGHKPR